MSFKRILFSNIYMRYPSGIDINRKLTSIAESSADARDGYYKAQAGTYNYIRSSTCSERACRSKIKRILNPNNVG